MIKYIRFVILIFIALNLSFCNDANKPDNEEDNKSIKKSYLSIREGHDMLQIFSNFSLVPSDSLDLNLVADYDMTGSDLFKDSDSNIFLIQLEDILYKSENKQFNLKGWRIIPKSWGEEILKNVLHDRDDGYVVEIYSTKMYKGKPYYIYRYFVHLDVNKLMTISIYSEFKNLNFDDFAIKAKLVAARNRQPSTAK